MSTQISSRISTKERILALLVWIVLVLNCYKLMAILQDGAINGSVKDITDLEAFIADGFHEVILDQHSIRLFTLISSALATPRLVQAQTLSWEDDFEVWWNAPLIRVAWACLRILSTGRLDTLVLYTPIGVWICLLCEPIARPRPTNFYDSATIETCILLFDLLSENLDDPQDLRQVSPDIARTVVGLFIAAFSNCNSIYPGSYDTAHTFAIIFRACDDTNRSNWPIAADFSSIGRALGDRYEEAALAIMAALHGVTGRKAGPRVQKVLSFSVPVVHIISLSIGIPTLRFALIQRGLVAALCLSVRRAVRGELENQATSEAFVYVVLDLLKDVMLNPQQIREALDAHILSTVLRIPDAPLYSPVPSSLPADADPIANAVAFLFRLSTFVIFPTLRHAFQRSFRHVDSLVVRGAITFPGDSGALLATEYDACKRLFEQRVVPPANTRCHNQVRHPTLSVTVVLMM